MIGTAKVEKPLNALQKVWEKMQKNKWTCSTCGVLVEENKKICPACEAPRSAPGDGKVLSSSSEKGVFGVTTTSTSVGPADQNLEMPLSSDDLNQNSIPPTFQTNLFTLTTSESGALSPSALVLNTSFLNQPQDAKGSPCLPPVFNTSFFNKAKDEHTKKSSLCPMGGMNTSPFSLGKKANVPATPTIPTEFNMIGIHSLSQPVSVVSKSCDILLKTLDPHRCLTKGSNIVMSCGFGGFAQLGLGEEEDDETVTEEDVLQMGSTTKVTENGKTNFSRKRKRTSSEDDVDLAIGTLRDIPKAQKVKWPAPNVIEAQIPLRMPNLDDLNIVSVEMGIMHGAVLTEDGRIFVWGGNDHSNLGFEGDDSWVPTEITKHFPKDTKIKKVTCGSSHTAFLTTQGDVFTAGTFKNDGWEGAFYDPKSNRIYKRFDKPTKLEYVRTANTSRGNIEQKKIGKMVDIASGLDHILMLDNDGTMWEMGVTILGQRTSIRNQHHYLQPRRVGLKNWKVKFRAIRCGSHYNLAISSDNDLYTWGQNNYLQCGHPMRNRQSNPELIDKPHKVNFNDPSVKLADVGAGTHTTIALDTMGRLWSFGRNGSFELGRETKVPPKQFVNGRLQQYTNEPEADLPRQVTAMNKRVSKISVGANHWFAVAEDSTTYAVGVNVEFRTGVADDEGSSRFVKVFHDGNLRQDFEVIDIAAGSNSSVFLLKRVDKRESKPKQMQNQTPSSQVKR